VELKRILGAVLKETRLKENVTQAKLAEICDLDVDYVSKIERGVRQPTVTTLFTISDALNTPLATIIAQVDKVRKSKK